MMNELERKAFIQDIQKGLEEFIIGKITIVQGLNFVNMYPEYIVQIKNKDFKFYYNIDNDDIFFKRTDKIITSIIQQYKKDIYKLFFFD